MRAPILLPIAALAMLVAASAAAAPAWEGAPFSADPAALLAEAKATPAPDGEDIQVFIEETTLSFDEQGRRLTRIRTVYRILTEAGARAWANSSLAWSPWYQERPRLEARVISPDGRVSTLDPVTLSEGPAAQGDSDSFSDRRVLRGPLPAIGVGAVVEELAEHREHRPFFEAGSTWRLPLSRQMRTERLRVLVEAPTKLALKVKVRGLALEPVRQDGDGKRRYLYELDPAPRRVPSEPYSPPEGTDAPYLGVSVGESWEKVAAAYGQIVEAQLADSADAAEVLKGLGKLPKERKQAAAVLLGWIHGHLRYTGVELGEAALVPRTPRETLSRQYGDCKDLSALLVALLRRAGFQADLALVSSGWSDVDPDLPGLGDFNHALVRIAANPPIWVEATDPTMAPGDLPSLTRGKRALIAGRQLPALVRIPDAAPADNRSLVVRELQLSELGPSRIVETREVSGTLAAQLRQGWLESDEEQLEKGQRRYSEAAFLTPQIDSFRHSDPRKIDAPATVRLEVSQARRGYTDEEEAVAVLIPVSLFSWIPSALFSSEDEEGPPPARRGPFWLPTPYQAELRFKVIPPAGFSARPLPDDVALQKDLGGARFSRAAKIDSSGAVEATFRFEISRRQWSPSEADQLREDILRLESEDQLKVSFERSAAVLLASGKVREALAEYDRLIALHPSEVLHQAQRAEALLVAGFGEAAREQARAAVAMEPKSAFAQQKLGYVLLHDELGRPMRRGFDRDGAILAYRAARELEPDNRWARRNLAVLLEYDADGRRYGPGARLEEAISELQALRSELKSEEMNQNLLIDLLRAGHCDKAREVGRVMPASRERDALLVAAVTCHDSAAAGLKQARGLSPMIEGRRATLESAAASLLSLRRYADAAALLSEAAPGASNETELRTRAAALERARPAAGLTFPDGDPASPLRRLILAGLTNDRDGVIKVISPRLAQGDAAKELAAGFAAAISGASRSFDLQSIPTSAVADLAMANMSVVVEGDDKLGYRLRATRPNSSRETVWYAVPEGKRYLLIAAGDLPWTLGAEALRRLRTGDLAGARRWLEWSGRAGKLGLASATSATAPQLERAAALLAADGTDLPVAELERLAKDSSGEERRTLLLALARAHLSQDRFEAALEVLGREKEWAGQGAAVFAMTTSALHKLERTAELESTIAHRLASDETDPAALELSFRLSFERGDFAAADRQGRRLVELGRASAWIFNDLAWQSLFGARPGPQALEDAQRAVEMSGGGRRSILHTLAAVQAELGKGGEARQTLLRSIDAGDGVAEEHDWYVIGRIAEGFGLDELARRAYRRLTPPKDPTPLDTWLLAKRRLERLGPPKDAANLAH